MQSMWGDYKAKLIISCLQGLYRVYQKKVIQLLHGHKNQGLSC